jgi:hypothetical protein
LSRSRPQRSYAPPTYIVRCAPRAASCPTRGLTGRTSRLLRCVCSSRFFGLGRQGRAHTCPVWVVSSRLTVPSAPGIWRMCGTCSCNARAWPLCGRSLLPAFTSPLGRPDDAYGRARRAPLRYAVVAPQHGGPLHSLGGLEIQKSYGVRPCFAHY